MYICIHMYIYICTFSLEPFPLSTFEARVQTLDVNLRDDECAVCLDDMRCGDKVITLCCRYVMYPPPHAMRPRSHCPLLPEVEGKKTILYRKHILLREHILCREHTLYNSQAFSS